MEQIKQQIKMLKKATVKDLARLNYGLDQSKTEGSWNSMIRRELKDLIRGNEIKEEKIKGTSVYMLKDLTGYSEHDSLITEAIINLALNWDVEVYREHLIKEVSTRPDAIVLVKNGEKRACCIVEAVCTETQQYLNGKIGVWKNWEGATDYLSNLFGHEVKSYHLLTHGKEMNIMTLDQAIQILSMG